MYDLKGKVAIVTGAGRKLGIGRAIALRLAREGADVAVADICREFEEFPDYGLGMWEGLKSTADEVSALGVRGLPLKVDVTDSRLVDEMVAQTMDAFGRIDILVNNAGGVVGPAPSLWIEEAAWNKTERWTPIFSDGAGSSKLTSGARRTTRSSVGRSRRSPWASWRRLTT